ncbi:sirohydrochlorin cobaltochelatase [Clostridiaceae bacterium UIB06]|uniref:Sirohydrochlorin cobaltochelatase n=1 Tax=Clostridium thailandense TaxID=2794346 RepID=A0A949TZ13_9CLOT|nr:sirohydrochlorin cobaltochelatase [Clostridium thailandense]MBV7275258.1 sirohydrochlorin cobaltochelatase [Clostridium thailandense]MCH5137769.1 sirohydrochlorin cobaltochelatase [Clostridiaceae bacterium UIB06]
MSETKKGILVASFGTSIMETFKNCIEATENRIEEYFPDYEIRRAFTSGMIMKKLKNEMGIHIDNVEEALEKMKSDGFTEVYVQPLHIMPGDEYDKIGRQVNKYVGSFDKLVLGRPILYREKDYDIAIEALKDQIKDVGEDTAIVLMGHGSTHHANACYAQLQCMLIDNGLENVYVGTVEGYPTLDNIIPKLKEKNIREVTLMPYMLVAGDHAINDMAGDEEDSWKSQLEEQDIKANVYLHGLGENRAYQDIYVQHVQDCIDGNPLMTE